MKPGTTCQTLRRTAGSVALLAASLLLPGCGGLDNVAGNISRNLFQPLVQAVVGAVNCAAVLCAYSNDLPASELTPTFAVTSGGGDVTVTASFTTGAVNQPVRLLADALTVSADGAAALPFTDANQQHDWVAVFATVGASRRYQIDLIRSDSSRLSTVVTLPAAFSILAPVAAVQLNTGSAVERIVVSTAAAEPLATRITGSCTGGVRLVPAALPLAPTAADGGASQYLLDPADLYRALDVSAKTAGVSATQCDLTLTLGRTLPAAPALQFRAGGTATGVYRQTLGIRFDANV